MSTKHNIKEYIPYTYLIGWSKLNKWYYGCEYGENTKTANPKNLWTEYFTSSDIVKEFRKKYGEPNIIEVRSVFKTAEMTLRCEERVLTKINAVKSENWLNQHIGVENFLCTSHSEKTKKKMSKTTKEKIKNGTHNLNNDHKNHLKEVIKQRIKLGIHGTLKENGGGKKQKEYQLKKINEGKHHFQKMNGGSELARKNALKRMKEGTHHFLSGEMQRENVKKLMKEGRHSSQQINTCPHCGKIGKGTIMFRHHFNKCKKRSDITPL